MTRQEPESAMFPGLILTFKFSIPTEKLFKRNGHKYNQISSSTTYSGACVTLLLHFTANKALANSRICILNIPTIYVLRKFIQST